MRISSYNNTMLFKPAPRQYEQQPTSVAQPQFAATPHVGLLASALLSVVLLASPSLAQGQKSNWAGRRAAAIQQQNSPQAKAAAKAKQKKQAEIKAQCGQKYPDLNAPLAKLGRAVCERAANQK